MLHCQVVRRGAQQLSAFFAELLAQHGFHAASALHVVRRAAGSKAVWMLLPQLAQHGIGTRLRQGSQPWG